MPLESSKDNLILYLKKSIATLNAIDVHGIISPLPLWPCMFERPKSKRILSIHLSHYPEAPKAPDH